MCAADGCVRAVKARGLCSTHYHRWWRSGGTDHDLHRCATCGTPTAGSTWCTACEPVTCSCPDPVAGSGFWHEHECQRCFRLLPVEMCS